MAKILNNQLIANALSTVFLMQFTYCEELVVHICTVCKLWYGSEQVNIS